MMDMGDMMERCADVMGTMMGGGMMGSGIMLLVSLLVLLVWVIGLVVVGALLFWGIRRLTTTRYDNW
jgi:hypothetical protein